MARWRKRVEFHISAANRFIAHAKLFIIAHCPIVRRNLSLSNFFRLRKYVCLTTDKGENNFLRCRRRAGSHVDFIPEISIFGCCNRCTAVIPRPQTGSRKSLMPRWHDRVQGGETVAWCGWVNRELDSRIVSGADVCGQGGTNYTWTVAWLMVD